MRVNWVRSKGLQAEGAAKEKHLVECVFFFVFFVYVPFFDIHLLIWGPLDSNQVEQSSFFESSRQEVPICKSLVVFSDKYNGGSTPW